MILSCNHISKAFGTDEILSEVSFHIEDQEKAAIVGINGAGKSTLLKIIVGELAPDSGEVVLGSGKTLGYLAQNQDLLSHRTIYEEMLDAKKSVIAMENRLRDLENSMKTASGEELETMMNQYSRLSHEFELINGYAWKSEIVGVLKGLGFTEGTAEHFFPGGDTVFPGYMVFVTIYVAAQFHQLGNAGDLQIFRVLQ